MASVPMPMGTGEAPTLAGEASGLQSLRSLKNLQSLQLNLSDAAAAFEAVPAAPATLREIEIHLTGEDWQTDVLDKLAQRLGAQVWDV